MQRSDFLVWFCSGALMETTEGIFPFSVASVVEDVLQQHGKRLCDIDLASRKAEEAGAFVLSWSL